MSTDAAVVSSSMRGVLLPGQERVELRNYMTPEPSFGQVLVKMKVSGLCGSDLKFIYREHSGTGGSAYRGVIAGHEPAGQVVVTGPGVKGFEPGDRVAVYHIAGCGYCEECRKGYMIGCTSALRQAYGWQRDGGHADYILAESNTLIRIPDELTYADGALVACGFGTAYQGILRSDVSGRDTVVVVGLGPVGLAVTMLASSCGARVIGIDPIATRQDMACRIGASSAILSDVHSQIRVLELTDGHGADVVFDCSGSASGRHLSLEIARTWGRVVFLGEGGEVAFEPSPLLIRKQLTLMGSWVCSLSVMEKAFEFLARRRLHPEAVVTHRYPLNDAAEAYRVFAGADTGKVVITME